MNTNVQLQFIGSDGHTYEVVKGVNTADAPGEFAPVVPWCNGGDGCVVHAAGVAGTLDVAWKFIFDGCKERKVKLTPVPRAVCVIAREIARNWASGKKGVAGIYFGAVPYLDAMRTMETATENYGADDGKSILLYFLGNANAYRGGLATAHKLELKALAGIKS